MSASSEGTFVSSQLQTSNKLLGGLSKADFSLLEPHLEALDLPLRRQLEAPNRPVEFVYFLDTGLASMVISAGADQSIEVGIVGNEGMTGLPVVLDSYRPTYETFIQTAGKGRRLTAKSLGTAMDRSPTMNKTFLRYVQTVLTQMACTALANGRYKIDERLARWLLMADDRAGGNPLELTHDFLALMLGSRRAGVTVALNELEKQGTIELKRRNIVVRDRGALELVANGSYGLPEAEYHRLFEPAATVAPKGLAASETVAR